MKDLREWSAQDIFGDRWVACACVHFRSSFAGIKETFQRKADFSFRIIPSDISNTNFDDPVYV